MTSESNQKNTSTTKGISENDKKINESALRKKYIRGDNN